MRKWGNEEMGKWGNGKMGKWENGKVGKFSVCHCESLKLCVRIFSFQTSKLPTVSFCPIAHKGN